MIESGGELFDLGYQHYDGPREGRMRARKALWTNGARSVLGLGRGSLAKVFPLILLLIAMGLALGIIIVACIVPDADVLDAAAYTQVLSLFMLLFAAVIAPDLLCPDRRDNVIHLYLVRPMSAADYVGARWLALFAFLFAIFCLGQAVRFAGLIFAAAEPLDYMRDNWLDVPRFLGAGLALAFFSTTLTLAISAFTTRRAYAQAFMIGLLFVSIPVAAILTGCGEETVVIGRYEGMDQDGNWLIRGNTGRFDEEEHFVATDGEEAVIREGRVVITRTGERLITVATVSDTEVATGLVQGDIVRIEMRHGADPPVADRIVAASDLCRPFTGDAAKWIALVDVSRVPVLISDMIFDKENSSRGYRIIAELPDIVPIAWYVLLIGGLALALWWRYQRISV